MLKTSTLLSLWIAALAGWACTSPRSSVADARDEPESIAYGYESGLDARAGLVLRDAAAWEHAWRENHRRVLPVPPLPEVDFEHEMVLAISIGPRPTAGYGVRIRSARVQAGKLRVEAVETKPAAGAILPTVVTHPYAFVRVPRFEGEVLFELR